MKDKFMVVIKNYPSVSSLFKGTSAITLLLMLPSLLFSQTKVENLKPEINSLFSLHRVTNKSNLKAEISQQFYTNQLGYTGITYDGTNSSNLVYTRLKLDALRKFNEHWYGAVTLQRQLGRYFFYNQERAFTTFGAMLGHKGKIDEITFYKELGANINNQKPLAIKDLYIMAKLEYLIKNRQKNFALASLTGKVDWLGTTFSSEKNDIFVLRSKDESFIKKVDQSWLMLNFDFFLSPKHVFSSNLTYFTEYYPTADLGFDKSNIKHYVIGLGWKYYFFKENVDIAKQMY